MSTVSTKRHSSQDHSHIEFGKSRKTKPHLNVNNRVDNLRKAKAYIDEALKSKDTIDLYLKTGNARVCLTRVLKSLDIVPADEADKEQNQSS